MATWSLCGRHAGPDKSPTPVFINLDNVLTVERQGDPDLPELNGAMGGFMLTTMASVAELEAGLISERTKAALKAAKARGVKLGRHGAEVLAPKFKEEARQRAIELEPIITELKAQGLSLARIAVELNKRRWRRPVEASGITRRWGTCCNVSQLEADHQIAGHWLPSRNDPALKGSNACSVETRFIRANDQTISDRRGRPAPQKTGLRNFGMKQKPRPYLACDP